jgi:tripartite ATP-independent transporter DctM subunit
VKIVAGRRGYAPSRALRASAGEILVVTRDAAWSLVIPIWIIVGIRYGAFTPTEAGAVAAVYAIVVSSFVYRELTLEKLGQALLETVLLTSIVMMIIAAANSLGFYLAWEQIPNRAAEAVLGISGNPYLFLLVFNILVLVLGMFMDGAMILVLLTPLLVPIIHAYGIDPVHFGVVFMLNLEIGAVTPPVGIVMYTATSISGVSIESYTREALPMFAALVSVLLLITYVPALVVWLPNLLFH